MKIESKYEGSGKRLSAFDLTFSPIRDNHPLVLFCHGYKGFKDWGAWNLVARAFANEGFDFLKFNFSHNGGTADDPIDFPDEEAFAKNTYSKELEDIRKVLDRIGEGFEHKGDKVRYDKVYLIGHSCGGGMAVLAAQKFEEVDKLVTWSAVSDFGERFNFDMAKWKSDGVTYVKNGRTGQMLPHNYTFYQDYIDNRDDLSIPLSSKRLKKPWLVAHGETDEAVCISNADFLKSQNPKAKLLIIKEAGHTFGSKHPWEQAHLPSRLELLVEETIAFLKG